MSPPPTGHASPTAEVELAALLEVEVGLIVEVKLVEMLLLKLEVLEILPVEVELVFRKLILKDGVENDKLTESDGCSSSGSSSGTSTSSGGVTTGLPCCIMMSIGIGIGMTSFPFESVVAFLHVAVTWQVLQETVLLIEVIMPMVDQLVTGPLLELVVTGAPGAEELDLWTVFVERLKVIAGSVEIMTSIDVKVAVGRDAATS